MRRKRVYVIETTPNYDIDIDSALLPSLSDAARSIPAAATIW
jgi:hypothetical protein